MTDRQLTRPELEILRRSACASGGLPSDQLAWLIGEADRLLVERERIDELVSDLRGPWPELRRVLNELHGVLRGSKGR